MGLVRGQVADPRERNNAGGSDQEQATELKRALKIACRDRDIYKARLDGVMPEEAARAGHGGQ